MSKEFKRTESNYLLEKYNVNLAQVRNFENHLRVLNQIRPFIVQISIQLLGYIGDRPLQKPSPLSRYVRNLVYGSYHSPQDNTDYLRALQTAVDLASVYILDQRMEPRQAIVQAVANTADYLGCFYLLKTEGLAQEMDQATVNGAIEYINTKAKDMAAMIEDFVRRAFPQNNVSQGQSYYQPNNSGGGVSSSYYSVDNPIQQVPYYGDKVDPYSVVTHEVVPPKKEAPTKYYFIPVRLDSTSWAFDPKTGRPLYAMEGETFYYYVHKREDKWILVNRSTLEHLSEVEFPNSGISLEGQPKPNPNGYPPKEQEQQITESKERIAQKLDSVFQSKVPIPEISGVGNSILEELTVSPDQETTYRLSTNLDISEGTLKSFAEENIIMTDFTAQQDIETVKVDNSLKEGIYAEPVTLGDGGVLALVTANNAAELVDRFHKTSKLPRYIPAFYPEKEMLFIKTEADGKTTAAVLVDDEEVIMNTGIERMMLASGISRSQHTQQTALKRNSKDAEETFLSGVDVSLVQDNTKINEERAALKKHIEEGGEAEKFDFNTSLSFNRVVSGADVFSAAAIARTGNIGSEADTPFVFEEPKTFIPFEEHPAEAVNDDGEGRKFITVLEKQNVEELVKFLVSDYGLGTSMESMTPIAWYIHDIVKDTTNEFIAQEMGLPRFVILDNLHADFFAVKHYLREQKGEIVAKVLDSNKYTSRIFAAIGNIAESRYIEEKSDRFIHLVSFTQVSYILQWNLTSQQIAFMALDDTILLNPNSTPSLYRISTRIHDLACEFEDRDKVNVYNCAFLTRDNRMLRIMKSPYSGDLLLTFKRTQH